MSKPTKLVFVCKDQKKVANRNGQTTKENVGLQGKGGHHGATTVSRDQEDIDQVRSSNEPPGFEHGDKLVEQPGLLTAIKDFFKGIGDKLDDQKQMIGKVDGRLDCLTQSQKDVQEKVDNITVNLSALQDNHAAVEKKHGDHLGRLDKRCDTSGEKFVSIESRINTLEDKSNTLALLAVAAVLPWVPVAWNCLVGASPASWASTHRT